MGRYTGGILWARAVGMARDCARDARRLCEFARRAERPGAVWCTLAPTWRAKAHTLRNRAHEHASAGRAALGGRARTYAAILADLSARKAVAL